MTFRKKYYFAEKTTGWNRLREAAALQEPDVLLLDEPTNHMCHIIDSRKSRPFQLRNSYVKKTTVSLIGAVPGI